MTTSTGKLEADIIVIGAGVAGLSAAGHLAHHGRDVLILEARNRIGGRILTEFPDGHPDLPAELGAEFVHGKHPMLMDLSRDLNATVQEISGSLYQEVDGRLHPVENEDDAFDGVLESPELATCDVAFSEFIQAAPVSSEKKAWTTSYVEGFNAADAHRISTHALYHQQKAEDSIEGETSSRIAEGYSSIAAHLAKRLGSARLELETVVSHVEWSPGRVSVTARRPDGPLTTTARALIVTVPIGVLLSRNPTAAIQFSPQPELLKHIDRIDPGAAVRLNLIFSEPIWESAAPDASFILSQDKHFQAWWPRKANSGQMLTAWSGGPKTSAVRGLNKDRLVDTALDSLSRFLHVSTADLKRKLESSHYHDWLADPFSSGAYSYVVAGGFDFSQEITRPVSNTIWFAGEATASNGYWGTVHGALESGIRAASQIVAE